MAPEMELLNAVAAQPYAACESQWKELLRSMNLGAAYIPVIQAVIKEGRWKNQPNPMAYLSNYGVSDGKSRRVWMSRDAWSTRMTCIGFVSGR